MNVFIARAGTEIGEYPRNELANLVRRGEIYPTDHYWHEGMEAWGLIGDLLGVRPGRAYGESIDDRVDLAVGPAEAVYKPIRHPKNWRIIGAVALGALLAMIALAVLLIKPGGPASAASRTASLGGPPPPQPLTGVALRDKAAADLKDRIERLPANATPPLNTFYYDVTVRMNKAVAPRTEWTAIIRGSENVIDPGTDETLFRTEFTLNADYTDGMWFYKSYHGSLTNMRDSTVTEAVHDEQTPTPPSIVGMLGLKRRDEPNLSISIAK